MAKSSGSNVRQTLARVTAAALTAALAATGTSAFAADGTGPAYTPLTAQGKVSKAEKFTASAGTAAAEDAQVNPLYGVDNNGDMWGYGLTGTGGLTAREKAGYGWNYARFITQADNDNDGAADGIWHVTDGNLYSWLDSAADDVKVGSGWNIYNRLFSAGSLGGAAADDLLARDADGVLWLYLGYGNGKVTSRYKVGSGWNAYTQLAGKGDLTGDGKDDIVAKDTSGVLWLYKGTGNYKAPFQSRTRIGGGWNIYNNLVSVGDIDVDGITDLIARDKDGALWLYKGTGNAAAPFQPRVKIGSSGWNTYRLMF
ncbi:VCBS repeat-containing protein [Streptomyces yaanensis]|uniref:VCBS repeat-containing protein n=1 Tax=Streptomyces yaanensis TaxID=1142239 RepID=A0ABV7SM66_9ACTN|nr:VCBS repeat-containing protein [Streptomyces sp. CGMCC 4.7035]WNC01730.1 VCBS repeat-containing protein [Streptomyces sp. CGMCC 4.7035]